MAITPDGQQAVCAGEDASVRCWHLDSGECRHTMLGHSGWVVSVAITRDSSTALTASHDASVRCAPRLLFRTVCVHADAEGCLLRTWSQHCEPCE